MKYIFYSYIIALVFSCKSPNKPSVNYEEQLIHRNHQHDTALIKADTAALHYILGDDYIYTNPDGKILNKAQQLLNIATSEMKWEEGKSEDIKVAVHGQIAVVTGAFYAKGSYRGNPLAIQERYTSVWVRRDTSWQLVAEQGNIIRQ